MKTTALTSLVLASLLSLATFGCAAEHEAGAGESASAGADMTSAAKTPKTIKATTDQKMDAVGGVWSVKGVPSDKLDLKLIEFGGGDPAMNGDQLFLYARGADNDGIGGVFELHQNVNTVSSVELTSPTEVTIKGTYDTYDNDKGNVVPNNPFVAVVALTTNDRGVTGASCTRDGNTDQLTAETDADRDFFGSLFGVKQQETPKGTVVRLYEFGGGDPAMNGDQLLLNVLAYPEDKSYELGLNVNTVQSLTVTENSATITGSEDYMGTDGKIKNRPYTYVAKFSIGANGAPADTISLTRTR